VSNSAHVRARNATITGACVVSLPGGVKHAVAGAPCSLLLRTNPPCDSRLDWEVNLVSFAGDSMRVCQLCLPLEEAPAEFTTAASSLHKLAQCCVGRGYEGAQCSQPQSASKLLHLSRVPLPAVFISCTPCPVLTWSQLVKTRR
jgi:hypothetical protein